MFENTTNYDEKLMKDVARFDCRTRLRKRILVTRCLLLLWAVGIFTLTRSLGNMGSLTRLCALVVEAALLLTGYCYETIVIQNQWKRLKNDCGERFFSFTEDGVEMARPGGAGAAYPYAAFGALYETEDYFILLSAGLERFSALRIDGFTKGNAGDFRKFLEEKTGKTFREIYIQRRY